MSFIFFLPFSSYQSISFCFRWFRFAFVGFVFISLISFRFVSFLLISFRFRWFRFVSFLFCFALYRYPIIWSQMSDLKKQQGKCLLIIWFAYKYKLWEISNGLKGILSTIIVIFSYPKLLSFSVLTFIKWRLTPSYAAKDTIFWQKKTQSYRYQNYCPGWQYSNLFIWPSMWTRLEHAHCLETINNMWFLGKRESVNSWNKADFDGFREKDE